MQELDRNEVSEDVSGEVVGGVSGLFSDVGVMLSLNTLVFSNGRQPGFGVAGGDDSNWEINCFIVDAGFSETFFAFVLKYSVILPCFGRFDGGSPASVPHTHAGCDCVGGISSKLVVESGEQGSVMSLLLDPQSPQCTTTPLKQNKKKISIR